MQPHRSFLACVMLATASPLAGCATTNVRAMRAYAYEDPNLVVALDRIEDIAVCLEQIDTLMNGVGYSPGDKWISALALGDDKAQKLKEQVRKESPYDNPEFQVPVVKMYRSHLAEAIELAKKENAAREGEPDYPSLLAAIQDLSGGEAVADAWKTYREANDELEQAEKAFSKVKEKYKNQTLNYSKLPEDYQAADKAVDDAKAKVEVAKTRLSNAVAAVQKANLKRGNRAAIAKDALTAFSIALRIDLEALALIPFAIVQTVRSLPEAPAQRLEDLKKRPGLTTITQISELPDHASSIKHRLERQLVLVQAMTDALASLTATEIAATAGFKLKESAVDQIVGVALDSFHANLDIEGEGFFYNQFGGDEKRTSTNESDGSTITTDLTGRIQKLDYRISPIWLLGFHFRLGFDFIKLPEAAGLNFGFATDRVFTSGGEIRSGSLAEELGITGLASDFFNAGLGVLGVKSSVKIASFTAGEMDVINVASNTVVETTPLRIDYKQIDVGYDLSFLFYEGARRFYLEELWVGYRYYNYALPRVLYELENTLPEDSKSKNYVYLRESEPHVVDSTYHLGGFRLRFGPGGAPRIHPFVDFGLYMGGGPVAYELCDKAEPPHPKDASKPDKGAWKCKQEDDYVGGQFALDMNASVGLRVRLTPKRFPVLAHAGLQWTGEFLLAGISQESEGSEQNTNIDYGGSDLFHGVQLHLRGEL